MQNMERYGATPAMEGIPVDPVAEWAAPGGETGLEKPMWRLGLTADGGESYPERAGEPDCIYYVRTGFCGYGNRCRFNHPRDRSAAMGSLRAGGVDYPERAGQPACQYYMRTGMCKFGASCKYHHPKQGIGSAAALTLNLYGYPSRPGERECTYYVKTGQCKFGVTCKFHHPQPAGIQEIPTQALAPVPTPSAFPTMQSPLQSSQQYGVIHPDWPVPRPPPILPGSYVPGSYPFIIPQGVLPVPGWTPYQAPVSPITSPSTQTAVGAGQITAYTGPFLSSSSLGPTSSSPKERAFPERPGEPECQYYLRTGDCKFGVTCKYHHPPGWAVPKSNLTLSPMGLPLRPGVSLCSHYAQNGVCKFGPSCKYDHPMGTLSYSPSASSLTDIPVAPYAIGSTNMTLAPSFSSSDMSPQAHSGFIKDPPQMSSMITASIGSLFSTGGVVSHQPSPQQSGQGTTSSVAGNGTDHGDEGHSSN